MVLQLGFDGAVKLLDRASIPEVLTRTLPRYVAFVEQMAQPITPERVYWRLVFSLLSVNTAFAPNELAYRLLRQRGGLPVRWRTLAEWLARVHAEGKVIMYAGQKAGYLKGFQATFERDSYPFRPNGDGSEGWRDRLQTIRGLARAKASFAVCLSDPLGAEVVCIDRHMARLLLGFSPKYIKASDYNRVEHEILAVARGVNAPAFAVQWCLWDAQRGHVEPHEALMEV